MKLWHYLVGAGAVVGGAFIAWAVFFRQTGVTARVVRVNASIYDKPDGLKYRGGLDPALLPLGAIVQRAGDNTGGYSPIKVPSSVVVTLPSYVVPNPDPGVVYWTESANLA